MNPELRAYAGRLAARFDALPERERAIAFVSGIALVAAALFSALLAPAIGAGRTVAQELARENDGIRSLRSRLHALETSGRRDPDEAVRRRIERLGERLATVDNDLDAWRDRLIPPGTMAAMLREVLARNRGLRLIEMSSIAPVALSAGAARALTEASPAAAGGDAQPRPAQPAGEPEGSTLYRHGLELRVRGSYLDQMRYLAELERMPFRMFWQDVEITADDYPEAVMRLRVFTLSLEKVYLSL
jgi:MSHA biogenesis protein MshJ